MIPLRTILSPDGQFRVQLFRRRDGTFGFEEHKFLSDEKAWVPHGRYSTPFLEAEEAALQEALSRVEWMKSFGTIAASLPFLPQVLDLSPKEVGASLESFLDEQISSPVQKKRLKELGIAMRRADHHDLEGLLHHWFDKAHHTDRYRTLECFLTGYRENERGSTEAQKKLQARLAGWLEQLKR